MNFKGITHIICSIGISRGSSTQWSSFCFCLDDPNAKAKAQEKHCFSCSIRWAKILLNVAGGLQDKRLEVSSDLGEKENGTVEPTYRHEEKSQKDVTWTTSWWTHFAARIGKVGELQMMWYSLYFQLPVEALPGNHTSWIPKGWPCLYSSSNSEEFEKIRQVNDSLEYICL